MTLPYRYAGVDVVAGGIMGMLGATMNQSAGSNLTTSALASLSGSAIGTYLTKSQEKFLSRQTALSTVLTTGTSALSYLVTDALIHKHHKPEMRIEIQHASDKPCAPCKQSWAQRAETPAQDTTLTR
jgi:hypothetical protein